MSDVGVISPKYRIETKLYYQISLHNLHISVFQLFLIKTYNKKYISHCNSIHTYVSNQIKQFPKQYNPNILGNMLW